MSGASQPKPNSSNGAGYTKQDLEILAAFFKIVKNYTAMMKLKQQLDHAKK